MTKSTKVVKTITTPLTPGQKAAATKRANKLALQEAAKASVKPVVKVLKKSKVPVASAAQKPAKAPVKPLSAVKTTPVAKKARRSSDESEY